MDTREITPELLLQITRSIKQQFLRGIVTGQMNPETSRVGRCEIEAVADALNYSTVSVSRLAINDAVHLNAVTERRGRSGIDYDDHRIFQKT